MPPVGEGRGELRNVTGVITTRLHLDEMGISIRRVAGARAPSGGASGPTAKPASVMATRPSRSRPTRWWRRTWRLRSPSCPRSPPVGSPGIASMPVPGCPADNTSGALRWRPTVPSPRGDLCRERPGLPGRELHPGSIARGSRTRRPPGPGRPPRAQPRPEPPRLSHPPQSSIARAIRSIASHASRL